MGWESFGVVGFDHGPVLQGRTRILHLQYFFKYVLSFSSVRFRFSFEHAVQLPFSVLLYSTFPGNYAFLSLLPSQIKNTQSADTVPVHGHSPLVVVQILSRPEYISAVSECVGEQQARLLQFTLLVAH